MTVPFVDSAFVDFYHGTFTLLALVLYSNI